MSEGESIDGGAEEPEPEIERRTLGRYALRYRIAEGGMGSVYLAQVASAQGFRKWVAIKTVHPHIARDSRFLRMFFDEARLAARLDHPNVCSVFDFGETDGTHYLAMEYLHGESLASLVKRWFKRRGVPRAIAARIIADGARGLHHAHELRRDDGQSAGVVHRDVSPQNVFVLYTGVAKIVDFGIARSEEQLGEKTRTGERKGKLAYMSPEQLAAKPEVDRRTDVWALGVCLWEATMARRLFRRANDGLTFVAVTTDKIPSPREFDKAYPEGLERIVMRALERDPAKRYATALELARDLEKWIASSGEPVGPDDVAQLMAETFADKKRMREDMLRQESGDTVVNVEIPSETSISSGTMNVTHLSAVSRPPPVPLERPRPGRGAEVAPAAAAERAAPPQVDAPGERGGSGRGWVLGVLVLLLAGAAAGGWLAWRAWGGGDELVATPLPVGPAGPIAAVALDATIAVADAGSPDAGLAVAVVPAADAGAIDAGIDETTVLRVVDAGSERGTPSARRHRRDAGPREPREPREPEDRTGRVFVPGGMTLPGRLVLTTRPSGVPVYEGGTLLGRTPIERQMTPGTHRLRLAPTDGSGDRSVTVDISPAATTVASFTLGTQ